MGWCRQSHEGVYNLDVTACHFYVWQNHAKRLFCLISLVYLYKIVNFAYVFFYVYVKRLIWVAFFTKIDRRIFALSLPNVITGIAAPLVALVDVGVAGRLEPNPAIGGSAVTVAHYVATVAVCTMLLSIIHRQFNFLRMSACGETAQSWGRRDLNGVVFLLVRNLMLSGILGLVLTVLSPFIRDVSLWLIDPDDEVVSLASNYFNIVILAAIPSICFLSLTQLCSL